jgi:hypothetical protein
MYVYKAPRSDYPITVLQKMQQGAEKLQGCMSSRGRIWKDINMLETRNAKKKRQQRQHFTR